jgi:hypothetical protein
MGRYTGKVLEEIVKESGLSEDNDPVSYGRVVDYLNSLGDNFGEIDGSLHKEITESLINYAVRSRKKIIRDQALVDLDESLKKANTELKKANVEYNEEYGKTGILFNRNPLSYQKATEDKLKAEKKVKEIEKKIELHKSKKSDLDKLIVESDKKLDVLHDEISISKAYFKKNFKMCDDPGFEKISGKTKSEVENNVIENYMKMLKAEFKNPGDKDGWVAGNEHGKEILKLRDDLSKKVINNLIENSMKGDFREKVKEYLSKFSDGDEDTLKSMLEDAALVEKVTEMYRQLQVSELYLDEKSGIKDYNPLYSDQLRKEAEKKVDGLHPEADFLIKKYCSERDFKLEAENYFYGNFKELLDIIPDPSCKKKIVDKYIEMRRAGFGEPEDNGMIFGLFNNNDFGQQILKEKSELSLIVVELKVKEYIDNNFLKEMNKLNLEFGEERVGKCEGVEEQLKLKLKKEAYNSSEIRKYNPRYCDNESSKIRKSVEDLRDQIKLYTILNEKIDKLKKEFKKENSDLEYISPFELMGEEERFNKIRNILKKNKGKELFDKACNGLLYKDISLKDYEDKYLSEASNKAIKDASATFLETVAQAPRTVESYQAYIKSWVEWLKPYSNKISKLRILTGDDGLMFLLYKVVIPYFYFIQFPFIGTFVNPWNNLSSKISTVSKGDGTVFSKSIKLFASYSARVLLLAALVMGVVAAGSALALPLSIAAVAFGAWSIPRVGDFALKFVSNLYEKYEIRKYGHRDHVRFSVNEDLENLLEDKDELESVKEVGKKIGKELDNCIDNIERLKKEIQNNPESTPQDLSWVGGAIISRLPAWLSGALSLSPATVGNVAIAATEAISGVSPHILENRKKFETAKNELEKFERRKEVLNNAWDGIKNKGEAKTNEEWKDRIVTTKKDIGAYLDAVRSREYNEKIILVKSEEDSFHNRFHKSEELTPEDHKPKGARKGPEIVKLPKSEPNLKPQSIDKTMEDANDFLDSIEEPLKIVKNSPTMIHSEVLSYGKMTEMSSNKDVSGLEFSKKLKEDLKGLYDAVLKNPNEIFQKEYYDSIYESIEEAGKGNKELALKIIDEEIKTFSNSGEKVSKYKTYQGFLNIFKELSTLEPENESTPTKRGST